MVLFCSFYHVLLKKVTQAVSYIFQNIINRLYPQVLWPCIQLVESPEAEPVGMEGWVYSCCMCAQSCPTLCNPMDCSPQAPLSMEFPRQEYWSGLSFPSPGDLPNPGIKTSPCLLHWQADSLWIRGMGSIHGTTPFYTRHLNTHGFWYLQGLMEPIHHGYLGLIAIAIELKFYHLNSLH